MNTTLAHEYKPQLRAEIMRRLRAGDNLLQAQITVQSGLRDILEEISAEIVKLHEEGQLR